MASCPLLSLQAAIDFGTSPPDIEVLKNVQRERDVGSPITTTYEYESTYSHQGLHLHRCTIANPFQDQQV